MKMSAYRTLNVELPISLYEEIEREANLRGQTKEDVVRERLVRPSSSDVDELIGDLIGSADDLPADLSTRSDAEFANYGADHSR